MAVCSDGVIYPNINKTKTVRRLKKKQRQLQRCISRKYEMNTKEGNCYCKTSNIIKSEKLLLKVHHRLRHLAKAVQEQGFYEIRRQIEYKAQWSGISVIIADRYYPSSKKCIICGNVKKDLKLSERIYRCEKCGNEIDRDVQAAINLKRCSI